MLILLILFTDWRLGYTSCWRWLGWWFNWMVVNKNWMASEFYFLFSSKNFFIVYYYNFLLHTSYNQFIYNHHNQLPFDSLELGLWCANMYLGKVSSVQIVSRLSQLIIIGPEAKYTTTVTHCIIITISGFFPAQCNLTKRRHLLMLWTILFSCDKFAFLQIFMLTSFSCIRVAFQNTYTPLHSCLIYRLSLDMTKPP